jgi:hypothetical protein
VQKLESAFEKPTPEVKSKFDSNDSTIESSTNEEAPMTTEKTVSDFLSLCKPDTLREELSQHESRLETLL